MTQHALLIAVCCGMTTLTACSTAPSGSRDGQAAQRTAAFLFDGSSTDAWVMARDGSPCRWEIDAEGAMVVNVGAGSIRTREAYSDFLLHLEFAVPNNPPEFTGQARGNSGVYLQGRYEVQIHDSHGLPPADNLCGAIYSKAAPLVNAARPAEEWQTYLIDFTSPRWSADGTKLANARISVHHNGILIHDDFEIVGTTGGGAPEAPTPGPILLQDHGDSRVRFRNIWIVPR
ncbi:MAG TPA: DUF1080 domain-containing protein [Phycisphaerales bacterium]|nr:DUF1080 domain-containing protein [Phycisphaerales bacterium]